MLKIRNLLVNAALKVKIFTNKNGSFIISFKQKNKERNHLYYEL